MEGYSKRLLEEAKGEYEEKKSRFIACIKPVASEEEAVSFIEGKKKEFWDARHNCSAYVVGEEMPKAHCSDDGEPSGTAGRPMLEVLTKEGLTNVAAVVTRYFGGVLLGTGGLVRAYQKSLKDAINNSELVEKKDGIIYLIKTDYNGMGKLQYYFSSKEIPVLDITYDDMVTMKVLCPVGLYDEMSKKVTEISSGTVSPEKVSEAAFGITKKGVHLF